jgi:hypothetical protein
VISEAYCNQQKSMLWDPLAGRSIRHRTGACDRRSHSLKEIQIQEYFEKGLRVASESGSEPDEVIPAILEHIAVGSLILPLNLQQSTGQPAASFSDRVDGKPADRNGAMRGALP